VRPLIVSTLREDSAKTEQARLSARATVAPERINIERGDAILSAGSPVDQVAIEKLNAAKLVSKRVEWRNVMAAAILSLWRAPSGIFVLQPRDHI
jgi:membrane-associated HD superfamily phosphohydrolase